MSLCPVGMASSQSITSLTACLTKDQNLMMECKFTLAKLSNATCTYEVDKKVVATTDNSKSQDASYKNRATAKLESNKCVLTLNGFSDDSPKMYNCTIQQEKAESKQLNVDKSKIYIYIYGPRVCQVN